MPLVPQHLHNQPTVRFTPIISITYNPVSRGFDVCCRKGHFGFNLFLKAYGRALVYRSTHEEYYIPEIYWHDLFTMAEKCHFQITDDLKEFYHHRKSPRWAMRDVPRTTIGGTELRYYQITAVDNLLKGNLILGDDMGLGKTLSTLHAWVQLRQDAKLVVVVPNNDVAGDWEACNQTHFGGRIKMHIIKSRKDIPTILKTHVSLIPYSKVWRQGYIEALQKVMPHCILCFDEGHRISRVGSQQHKGCYKLAERAAAVWVLSGTEVSNTPDQYYGMYRVVRQPDLTQYACPPQLGSINEKDWIKHYRDTSERNQWNKNNLNKLSILRQGFALRRTKEEVQKDLPPLIITTCPVTMDPITRKIYNDLEVECKAELIRQGNPEVLKEEHFWTIYLRLIQLCSHPLLLGEERVPIPAKWERVEGLISEAAGAQNIGIWSNFPRTIDWIAEQCRRTWPWLRVEAVHGQISTAERERIKLAAQAGEVDITIANPAIWGEGVNLQAITSVIYWDLHPSLVRWRQSKARSHRMGQTKAVNIWVPAYRNSVDMHLLNWLEEKTKLSRLITGN